MIISSPQLRRDLLRILPFGFIWLITGWVFLFIEQAIIIDSGANLNQNSAIILTPKIVVFASISVFLVGSIVGLLEVLYINTFFTKRSFPQKLLGKFLFYSILMFLVMFVFYQLAASIEMETSVFNPVVFRRYKEFLFSITYLSTSVQLAFSLLLSLLYAEISDNLGQNVLLNFFIGKYHSPKNEQRIFLFTDLNQSTTIAEQLGHLTYFSFLQEYYNCLSNAILKNKGEVYQYIGDEIVISWKVEKNDCFENAVQCFFDMRQDLSQHQEHFIKTYGIAPEFKGGIHSGQVTVGEIGALKKEIFFTGDVLNTTSRLQSLCAKHGKSILISDTIAKALNSSTHFSIKEFDTIILKGKKETISVFEITSR